MNELKEKMDALVRQDNTPLQFARMSNKNT